MQNHLSRLNAIISERVEQSGMPHIAFGIFGLINYPLSYLYFTYVDVQKYANPGFRIFITFLCLLLLLKKQWPKLAVRYFPMYWYFVILVAIPMFGTFSLLQNQINQSWITNMLLGCFLFVLLVDWVSFVVLFLLGSFFGALLYVGVGNNFGQMSLQGLGSFAYMYIFVFIIGGFFSRKNHLLKKLQVQKSEHEKELALQKAEANKQAAGSIAHDLRTPLASIQSAMSGIDHNLPRLINGYQAAKNEGLQVERIRKENLETLKKITESCISEINFSNHYINLILANLGSDDINTDNFKSQTIANLIKESVQSYPCTETKRALIHMDLKHDFEFLGDDAYVKNMINNLLKNSFHYIAEMKKGEIFIKTHTSEDNQFNCLSFKDTAKGASSEVVQHMFDGFYSKRRGGTGLGLSFCKKIMNSFGGNIEAQSVEGKYIEFLLIFPKLS